MIRAEACQKGGPMRSKSAPVRPAGEESAGAKGAGQRPPLTPGSLILVGSDARPAPTMKPGLY
jgi:hypothetical protein